MWDQNHWYADFISNKGQLCKFFAVTVQFYGNWKGKNVILLDENHWYADFIRDKDHLCKFFCGYNKQQLSGQILVQNFLWGLLLSNFS